MPTTLKSFIKGAKILPEIFKLRQDYRAFRIVAREALLKQPVTEVPRIAAWREAYKAFGAKPKMERNSLESLMRRAEGGLPRVNRLTDIHNAISIKHPIPLISATGQETFVTSSAGEPVTECPPVGEVVWCDDAGVTCRRWNWRQCSRTALSDGTTRVLLILDALEPCTDVALENAADELAGVLGGLSPDVRTYRCVLGGD
ncbi:hypothetical protein BCR34DRAFT_626985 [Clohesyomyces aquaticus]|uniref:B3/B4 tRNA-binding domain-containing protein n=1 Tax=Clohesyomyces aquaticus TaxID=1231657 RepID=A0A1Y1Z486_9PLEO|nr:hypothetical protein BCR34DRAFT_626985 [Clohesyomyces aquaticus]